MERLGWNAALLGQADRRSRRIEESGLWNKIRPYVRGLDMAAVETDGSKEACIDLDKVSGRFLAAGTGQTVILHDTARFQCNADVDDEPLGVLDLGREALVDLHWFPHDTGMITAGLASGSLLAWDTAKLSRVELLKSQSPIWCHALCPDSSTKAALGTGLGTELYDLRKDGRALLLRDRAGTRAMAWDLHRSAMLMCGSDEGQISQWDLRQPSAPLFSASLPKAKRVDKISLLPGAEGNLPAALILSSGIVFSWSMLQGSFRQVSPEGKKTLDFDTLPDLDLCFMANTADEILLSSLDQPSVSLVFRLGGLGGVVVNRFAGQLYAHERAHEKLRCFVPSLF